MNTKKAVLLATLTAITLGLIAFSFYHEEYKPKITQANAEELYNQKNEIIVNPNTSGYTYELETLHDDNGQSILSTWQKQPNFEYYDTERYWTNLENTTWTFNSNIGYTTPSGINIMEDLNPNNYQEYQDMIVEQYSVSLETARYIYMNIVWTAYWEDMGNNEIEIHARLACTKFKDKVLDITYDTGETICYLPDDFESDMQDNNRTFKIISGTLEDGSGNEYTDTNLSAIVHWFEQNATTQETAPMHQGHKIANHRTETKNSNYVGIEYSMFNIKTFEQNKENFFTEVKSEGLFLVKFRAIGTATELRLTNAFFRTNLPSYTRQNYETNFKFALLPNIEANYFNSNVWNQRNSYENFFDNLPNKNLIYSAKYSGTERYPIPQQETGTKIAHFNKGATENSGAWYLDDIEQDIMTGRVISCFAVYYNQKNRLSSYAEPTTAGQMERHHIGYTHEIEGYSISSVPITPPDIEDGNFISLTGMILNILSLPFTFISKAFDLTLWANTPWAFSIKNFIFTIIAILSVMFIIKLFTSGFSVFSNYVDSRERARLTKQQRKESKSRTKLNNRTNPNEKHTYIHKE